MPQRAGNAHILLGHAGPLHHPAKDEPEQERPTSPTERGRPSTAIGRSHATGLAQANGVSSAKPTGDPGTSAMHAKAVDAPAPCASSAARDRHDADRQQHRPYFFPHRSAASAAHRNTHKVFEGAFLNVVFCTHLLEFERQTPIGKASACSICRWYHHAAQQEDDTKCRCHCDDTVATLPHGRFVSCRDNQQDPVMRRALRIFLAHGACFPCVERKKPRLMLCGILAQAAIVYTTACCIYLLSSRLLPTPLYDSFTDYQNLLRRRSAGVRRRLFVFALLAAAVMVRVGRYCGSV